LSEHAPIIITGANIGLGYDTARALLESNPNQALILAVRDVKRGETAARQLASQTGTKSVEVRALNLASLQSIRRFVKDLGADKALKVPALICNAGLQMVKPATKTADGFETTFGVNHLGHFLLANLMLPLMADTGASCLSPAARMIRRPRPACPGQSGVILANLPSPAGAMSGP
jgi:NAD(P)-dependent dehydrogenase (short-subunit alcohol dehydrogenase family)